MTFTTEAVAYGTSTGTNTVSGMNTRNVFKLQYVWRAGNGMDIPRAILERTTQPT